MVLVDGRLKVSFGNFLENDFWTPPPPINFVHDHIFYFFSKLVCIFRIIGYVAAALGPGRVQKSFSRKDPNSARSYNIKGLRHQVDGD